MCIDAVGPCFMIMYPLPSIRFSLPYHVLHPKPPTLMWVHALVAW
jgi:hypothetical protein